MLDNEPDANDHNPAAEAPSVEAPPTEAPPAAAPRRRRAATRKAGPPAVSSDAAGAAPDQGPSDPPANDAAQPESTPAAEQAPPAKKTARKRTAKTAESGTRPARKRTTKKAAAAPPAEEQQPFVEQPASEQPASEQPPAEQPPVEERPADVQPTEEISLPETPDPSPTADEPTADEQPAAEPIAKKAPGDEAAAEVDPATPTDAATAPTSDQPDQSQPELSQPEQGEPEPSHDAEAALDEIRLALSADLPPSAPTEETSAGDTEAETTAADTTADDTAGDAESDEDDSDEDESDSDSPDDSDDETGAPRRRRRRRGGRRRRRGGGSDNDDARDGSRDQQGEAKADQSDGGGQGSQPSADATAAPSGDSKDAGDSGDSSGDEDSASDDSGDDSGNDEGGQRRRRRRRRRRGEDNGPSADDPAEVVVRVREPRSRKQAAQEVTGIEGSTRMEAKRQRRREGREAGRRRAPILSEAEFLARREAVVRKMIIRQREELSQIAVLEDDILVEHYVDRESAASLIGNVYLGRVQNVLPSMEAAFIDIGRGRNAVLYAGEVDWDAFGANGQQRKVENVLKSGQTVLVQVTKDPVGAKGARLTSHITLPGRYIVYAPGGHLSGISRKLPDTERKRLKSVLNDLVPESASVIVRTAAEGASEDELVRDVNRLKAQWEDIERKGKQGSAPKLLYGEPDLTVRIVRDLFTEDFAELIIQGNGSQADAYDSVESYVSHVAPHLQDRLKRWDGETDGDLFAKFRLDEQIAKALERKVFLPSGGSLIIDRTEAMTVIDVNTGKFTGSGGNLEATVTSNNLEAAEEIVRQLRLRDIGGIIVIDFIDMVLPSNRELLLRRLVECLGRDRTRHQVAEVTSLGLVQMTRKKIGTGLLEAFTAECEHCHGRGYEIYDMPVETQKQPDGGSRDHRGGGRGGRGRGNQSGSGSNSNGKPHHPVPTPPLHRPDPVPPPAEESTEPTPVEPPAAEPVAQQPQDSAPEVPAEQEEAPAS